MRRQRFALLGHPVAHSVSPAMFSAAFDALSVNHVYAALDVPDADRLRLMFDDLRSGLLAGANVTLPHKQAVMELADFRAPSAEEVGAANVLTVDEHGRITAHNTDVEALAAELDAHWAGRPRGRVAVVGGGGAGLAAMAACKRAGFRVICATSRSWTSTEKMFDSPAAERARAMGVLTSLWPGPADPGSPPPSKASQVMRLQWRDLAMEADCVIQATSAGMTGGPPGDEVIAVVPWERLPAHALLYDVVYNPEVTPFLQTARARGFRAVGGLGMLVRQAQLAFHRWLGVTPPADVMRLAAEGALAGHGSAGETR
jgi:shikimate dehydrogenase